MYILVKYMPSTKYALARHGLSACPEPLSSQCGEQILSDSAINDLTSTEPAIQWVASNDINYQPLEW